MVLFNPLLFNVQNNRGGNAPMIFASRLFRSLCRDKTKSSIDAFLCLLSLRCYNNQPTTLLLTASFCAHSLQHKQEMQKSEIWNVKVKTVHCVFICVSVCLSVCLSSMSSIYKLGIAKSKIMKYNECNFHHRANFKKCY